MIVIIILLAFLGALLITAGYTGTSLQDVMKSWFGNG